jgi:sigma-B regulation protein RsbU (phosphoserine phosphatase)
MEKIPRRDGLPLGIFEETAYTSQTVILGKNDLFVVYTDGITDAINDQGQMYGEAHFLNGLGKSFQRTPKEIIAQSLTDIKQFSGNGDPYDDITLFVLKYIDSKRMIGTTQLSGESTKDYTILRISNQITEITAVNQWLETLGVRWDLSMKNVSDINLVLEELISNIIFYGYSDDEAHIIEIEMEKSDAAVHIRAIDDGKPFNILEGERPPEISLSIEDRSVGGLGIHLITRLTDNVEYKRESGKNIVTLIKKLNT